ncbi:MAG: c-type cytochrome [Bacteroidetes bacterium]|nr:c-type cytochrome [Bacteroidota bacterium]
MKKKQIIFLGFLGLTAIAFKGKGEKDIERPKHFPEPTYSFQNNPMSVDKIYLGRVLFYDPILSRNNTIACSNCHSPYNAFTHVDHALSHGIEDREGKRNSPALMNLAWQPYFMWDGAINHLDMQSLFPITHPDEMGETIENVVMKLKEKRAYRNLFLKAYGDSSITGERLLKAFSSFMVQLVSANSKYDSVMRKTSIFASQEKRGYDLFKTHCNACHTEPLFTNYRFESNGLSLDPVLKDIGRAGISQNPKDSFLFKIPTLRNIEFSYPYMHDGRFKKLKEVLNHYNKDFGKGKYGSVNKPIQLSSEEQVDLMAFLLTLSDRAFLFNQDYAYPREFLKEGK